MGKQRSYYQYMMHFDLLMAVRILISRLWRSVGNIENDTQISGKLPESHIFSQKWITVLAVWIFILQAVISCSFMSRYASDL